jgi:hypothetical protein
MMPWQNIPMGDYAQQYQQTLGGAQNIFGNATAANNQFMTSQAVAPFLQNLPGYANQVGQRSENTLAMLKGEVPDDVINQISTQAAERGISGGVPQSPNANAAYLRALGLTSLDLMGEGSKQLSQSVADTPVPELFNPASLWAPQYQQQQALGVAQAAKQRSDLEASNKKAALAWNAAPRTSYNYAGGFGGF